MFARVCAPSILPSDHGRRMAPLPISGGGRLRGTEGTQPVCGERSSTACGQRNDGPKSKGCTTGESPLVQIFATPESPGLPAAPRKTDNTNLTGPLARGRLVVTCWRQATTAALESRWPRAMTSTGQGSPAATARFHPAVQHS